MASLKGHAHEHRAFYNIKACRPACSLILGLLVVGLIVHGQIGISKELDTTIFSSSSSSDFIEEAIGHKSSSFLPCCSPFEERCDWQKTPPFTIPDCEKENLLVILQWVDRVFQETHIPITWMITAGTLLGSIRQQGHIPHETDIDITVDKGQWEMAMGLIAARLPGTHFGLNAKSTPARVFFSKKNEVHLDIWPYVRLPKKNVTEEIMPKKGAWTHFQDYLVDDEILFPRSQNCEYEGRRYPCPHQSERYLLLRYGKDWQIPKPKYSPNATYKDGDDSGFLRGKGSQQKKWKWKIFNFFWYR